MRHRSIRVSVSAAIVVASALAGIGADAPLYAKEYPLPPRPQQVQPPPVQLIKCAAGSYFPCWPDPGMMRLGPPRRRFNPPLDMPPSGPSR